MMQFWGYSIFCSIFDFVILELHLLRSIGEESFAREVFEEYIMHLQEKAKEKERKREEEKVCDILLI